MKDTQIEVRFVTTPFLPYRQPALGVSSLISVLQRAGIRADIKYLNIEYLLDAGLEVYGFLSEGLPSEWMLGEMIFANALWDEESIGWAEYKALLHDTFTTKHTRLGPFMPFDSQEKFSDMMSQCARLRTRSRSYIQKWADDILQVNPGVVGFSSTFQQNIASLALAKELRKRRRPDELLILFGGANCEDDMGRAMADSFDFIDCVVTGESEDVILPIVTNHFKGKQSVERFVSGVMVPNLNNIPTPEFTDYFDAIRDTEVMESANLVAESSRGCWWGAVSQCKFCGLNGTHINFRSRDPQKMCEQLVDLARRYGPSYIMMADNILSMSYIDTLFPELIKSGEDIKLFYETKANLSKRQLEMAAAGGTIKIQPGIESLSTSVLKLMGKGTTRLQNIQLLKWCEEFNVRVKWNMLAGFPGESREDLFEMTLLMSLLTHLPPPSGTARFRLDRFSPYWAEPRAHGIKNVRRFWSLDYVYAGLDDERKDQLAYFYEYDYANGQDPDSYLTPVVDASLDWNRQYRRGSSLEIRRNNSTSHIVDTRFNDNGTDYQLSYDEELLLKTLDSMTTRKNAFSAMNKGGKHITASAFDAAVDRFLQNKWIIEETGKLLSLVVDRTEIRRVHNRRAAILLHDLGLPVPSEWNCGDK